MCLVRSFNVTGPTLSVIMSNPSTATETEDDQTTRLLVSIALKDGYGRLEIYNMGPALGLQYVSEAIKDQAEVVVAWGKNNHAAHLQRFSTLGYHGSVKCFALLKNGAPAMPLYRHYEGLHAYPGIV